MSAIYASTSPAWFERLSRIDEVQHVAFWQPKPAKPGRINAGERWYFKELKAPRILGYGQYVRWKTQSINSIFNEYGSAAGYDTIEDLFSALRPFREDVGYQTIIGNVVLENFTALPAPLLLTDIGLQDLNGPFAYLDEDDPIAPHVARFLRAAERPAELQLPAEFQLQDETLAVQTAVMRKGRIGQDAFRRLLLGAYGSVCAVSGAQPEEILQAAHIQPYVNDNSNHIGNGLLLRADIHILFDAGLLTLDADFKIKVSEKLSKRSKNFNDLNGRKAHLGNNHGASPANVALEFHRKRIFNAI